MMVAYNKSTPPDRNRMLSPEIADRLRLALAARWASPGAADDELTTALTAAAVDAKSRQLRPEELLIVLKQIEVRVADSVERITTEDRERFRHWLVGACLRAYFDE